MDMVKKLNSTQLIDESVLSSKMFIGRAYSIINETFPELSDEKKAELTVELTKGMVEDYKGSIIA